MDPDIQVDTFWTSLLAPAEEIIQLYADHGTSEQFHSEIKSDMDLERLPSGKFETNQVILHIGAFAYNVLESSANKASKDPMLPLRTKRSGDGSGLIQNLITLACRVVYHARYYKLSFGAYCPWFKTFKRLYLQFA